MRIETATGPIHPDRLGGTMMHEHLEAIAPAGLYSGGRGHDLDRLVEPALACLTGFGIRSVVDLTGRGRVVAGHDLSALDRLAPTLPIQLVVGYSQYKNPWLQTVDDDLGRLVDLYVSQAEVGVGRTQIKAGIFGEIGTSLDEITPGEELHLRAAARAHTLTGLSIYTHCTLGTMAPQQVEVLRAEGVDLSRVVIGHLDLKPDLEYLLRVLDSGVTIGFDTFGKEWFDYRVPGSEGTGGSEFVKWAFHRSDQDRRSALVELIDRGYETQIVLSTDMSAAEAYLNPSTHGRYGYAYLHEVVIPRLRAARVEQKSIETMLVRNPARILAIP